MWIYNYVEQISDRNLKVHYEWSVGYALDTWVGFEVDAKKSDCCSLCGLGK